MANNLIIGLGGTGGSILRYLHERIEIEECWKKKASFSFLYVDCINEHPKVFGNGDFFFLGNHEFSYQKRAVGHRLFAASESDLKYRIRYKVEDLNKDTCQADLCIHLFSGLAGGVGSGCLVDLLSMVYFLYPEARISVHAVLPERMPFSSHDVGYYHANGYAALQELNAWAMEWERRSSLPQSPRSWFHLYGDENANGNRISKSDLCRMIADCSFSSVIHDDVYRMFYRAAELRSFDNKHYPLFISMGLFRFVYPERLISNYLVMSLCEGLLSKLAYNYFIEGEGYVNKERCPDNERYINYSCLRLAELSRLSLDDDEDNNYPSFALFWDYILSKLDYQEARKEAKKRNMDNALYVAEQNSEEAFNTGFRGKGVNAYFIKKREDINVRAYHLMTRIESMMNNDEHLSIYDKCVLVKNMLNHLDELMRRWRENDKPALTRIVKEEEIEKARVMEERGRLSFFLFGGKKYLRFQNILSELYLHKTQLVANDYAIEVAGALCKKLNNYASTLLGQISKIERIRKELESLKDEIVMELEGYHPLVKYLYRWDEFLLLEYSVKTNRDIMDGLYSACKKHLSATGLVKIDFLTDIYYVKKVLIPFITEYVISLEKFRKFCFPCFSHLFNEVERMGGHDFVTDVMTKSGIRIALNMTALGKSYYMIWQKCQYYLPAYIEPREKWEALTNEFNRMLSLRNGELIESELYNEVDVLQVCIGFSIDTLEVYPILLNAYERVKDDPDFMVIKDKTEKK